MAATDLAGNLSAWKGAAVRGGSSAGMPIVVLAVRGRNPSGGSPSKQMGFNPDSGTVQHVRAATDSNGWEHRALNNGSKETLIHAAARQD